MGESDEKPFRPTDVAEPIRVFVLDDLADELRSALAEGIFPGDLLFMVLTVDASYWHANVEQWDRVDGIVDSLAATYEYVRGPIDHFKFGIWK